MRRLLFSLALLATALLAGCDVRQRFAPAEDRINAALPLTVDVRQAHERFVEQLSKTSTERATLDQAWAARLRARAVSCSPDFTPSWRHSTADIEAAVKNKSCFAEFDRKLARWLAVQRIGQLLAQPPLPVAEIPPSLTMQGEGGALNRDAGQAPVIAVTTTDGLELIALGGGRSLFKERGQRGDVTVAPNGRLFAQSTSGALRIRASEGGETLLELPDARWLYWLSPRFLGVRSTSGKPAHLLSLRSGEDVPVQVAGQSSFERLLPVPGNDNRFNIATFQGLYQLELDEQDGKPKVTVVAEKPGVDRRMGVVLMESGPIVFAGAELLLGGDKLVRMDLNTLDMRESSFEPARVSNPVPTGKPDQYIVSLTMQGSAGGVGAGNGNYLFDAAQGTLARLQGAAWQRPMRYFPAIKRVAQVSVPTIWLSEQLEAAPAQPVDEVVTAMLEEANQRVLQQAATEERRITQSPALQVGSPLLDHVRDAQVEGVGIYEGREKFNAPGQSRAIGRVTVTVRRSLRPLVLVLTSYEAVQWHVRLEPGARLAAVLLGGYYESTVLGAGEARVLRIGRTYAYQQEGQEFQALQREVSRWAGRPVSLFQTGYHGTSFTVGGS
ncbi:hypothetical protein [Roseateles sp. LYH14W]|uniref:Uncharacterized protein n=1 Tax=Pelomonas parva TaxID=3299032 RepID=A0ABW7F2B8_9BURK